MANRLVPAVVQGPIASQVCTVDQAGRMSAPMSVSWHACAAVLHLLSAAAASLQIWKTQQQGDLSHLLIHMAKDQV